MYVNAFLLGILATIFVEMAIVIAIKIVIPMVLKANKQNTNKR